jgi:hypothetical protein
MLEIEKERAKENMSKGGKGERVGNVSNPSDEPNAARDKAADKMRLHYCKLTNTFTTMV